MNNLAHFVTYQDREAHIEYQIYSHKKLNEDEQVRTISKKTLHTVLGHRSVYPDAPVFQIVKIVAGDGWEAAE